MRETYGCALYGGDTVKTPGPLTISITAFGTLPRGTMVHREGARVGDRVFVCGLIGDAALGLKLRREPIAGRGVGFAGRRGRASCELLSGAETARAACECGARARDRIDGCVGRIGWRSRQALPRVRVSPQQSMPPRSRFRMPPVPRSRVSHRCCRCSSPAATTTRSFARYPSIGAKRSPQRVSRHAATCMRSG